MVRDQNYVHKGNSMSCNVYRFQGRSQDFREGGADYARAQILATPTYEMERSKFKLSQRTLSDGS